MPRELGAISRRAVGRFTAKAPGTKLPENRFWPKDWVTIRLLDGDYRAERFDVKN
jgi:hypothetical protein